MPVEGSSSSRTAGRRAQAAASSTMRREPVDSSRTNTERRSPRPTSSTSSWTRRRTWSSLAATVGRWRADDSGSPTSTQRCIATARASSTVMAGKSSACWNDRPRPARARRSGDQRVTSRPPRRIRPPSTGTNPETRSNSVVFPAPLAPMMPSSSPGARVSDTSSTAFTPPKLRVSPSTSSGAGAPAPLAAGAGPGAATPPAGATSVTSAVATPTTGRGAAGEPASPLPPLEPASLLRPPQAFDLPHRPPRLGERHGLDRGQGRVLVRARRPALVHAGGGFTQAQGQHDEHDQHQRGDGEEQERRAPPEPVGQQCRRAAAPGRSRARWPPGGTRTPGRGSRCRSSRPAASCGWGRRPPCPRPTDAEAARATMPVARPVSSEKTPQAAAPSVAIRTRLPRSARDATGTCSSSATRPMTATASAGGPPSSSAVTATRAGGWPARRPRARAWPGRRRAAGRGRRVPGPPGGAAGAAGRPRRRLPVMGCDGRPVRPPGRPPAPSGAGSAAGPPQPSSTRISTAEGASGETASGLTSTGPGGS